MTSLKTAAKETTDVPVLLLNQPTIVQWRMSEFFFSELYTGVNSVEAN